MRALLQLSGGDMMSIERAIVIAILVIVLVFVATRLL